MPFAHGDPVRGRDNIRKLMDRMIEYTVRFVDDIVRLRSTREGAPLKHSMPMPHCPF
jgi:hypothetical protein